MERKKRYDVDVLLSDGEAEFGISIPAKSREDAITATAILLCHGTGLKIVDAIVTERKEKQPIGFVCIDPKEAKRFSNANIIHLDDKSEAA